MSKENRGERTGTGPYEDSWQFENIGRGRREEVGEECPFKIKEIKIWK